MQTGKDKRVKLLQKTRKGATSMIVIIFFTLLAGILVLSFVSIMVMNISESTNFILSQSAYDSALAGIEDAKVMLLEYNTCTARGDTTSSQCKKVVEEVNRSDSNEDCDLVRKALNRATGDNETLIRSDNTSINNEEEVNIKCLKVLFLSQKTAFAKRQKPTFINRKTGRLLIIEWRF